MIPLSFIQRLLDRFTKGNEVYGENDWKKRIEKNDKQWMKDRFIHAAIHFVNFKGGDKTDDHLAAIAWFVAMAMVAEENGVNWKEVLKDVDINNKEKRR